MTTRKQFLANERKTDALVRKRAGGRCERCGGTGDWRGLAVHHIDPKGMGGTRHLYTVDEKTMRCYPCHSAEHRIHEVKG